MNKRIHLISLYYLFLIVVWNHLTVFVNNYESTYTSYFSLQRNTGEDNSRAVCDKRTLCQMRLLLWLENKSNRNRKLRQEVIPHWEIWLIQVKQSQNQIHFKQFFLKQSRSLEKKSPWHKTYVIVVCLSRSRYTFFFPSFSLAGEYMSRMEPKENMLNSICLVFRI